MNTLNNLETAILNAVLMDNRKQYPFLLEHLPYLFVLNREFTGVGSYTTFGYSVNVDDSSTINDAISSTKSLFIDDFTHEFSYILNLTNGKIDFLEIITNGNDNWDGSYKKFSLEQN